MTELEKKFKWMAQHDNRVSQEPSSPLNFFKSEAEKRFYIALVKWKHLPWYKRIFTKRPILQPPEQINCRCVQPTKEMENGK